jgi:Rrf2 family protein
MITKKTEYAIRALWDLAHRSNGQATANQIAQRQGVPPKYLPQIISELTRTGLVNSSRGFGGGLRLGRDAKDISLLDIIEAVQGKLYLFECQISQIDCIHLPECDLKEIYNRAQHALESVFRDSVLADLKLGGVPERGYR